jgi:hypothetical protein
VVLRRDEQRIDAVQPVRLDERVLEETVLRPDQVVVRLAPLAPVGVRVVPEQVRDHRGPRDVRDPHRRQPAAHERVVFEPQVADPPRVDRHRPDPLEHVVPERDVGVRVLRQDPLAHEHLPADVVALVAFDHDLVRRLPGVHRVGLETVAVRVAPRRILVQHVVEEVVADCIGGAEEA